MKRRFLVGGLILVLVLASLTGLLWLKLGESFQIGHLSGSLDSGMTLDDLRIEAGSFGLRCRTLRVNIHPAALWQGRLHLQTLRLEGLEGWHTATPGSPPPLDLRFFPLTLIVDELSVHDGVWQRPGQAEPLRIEQLSTGFTLDHEALQVSRLLLENRSLWINGSGSWHFAEASPLTARLDWRVGERESPLAEGQGSLQGDATHLTARQSVSHPVAAQLTADIHPAQSGMRWTARLDLPRISLQQWHSDWPNWPVQGSIRAENQAGRVQFSAEGTLELPGWDAVALTGQLDYTPGQPLKLSRLDLTHPSTGTHVTLQGGWNADKSLHFDGQWQNLRWPKAPPWTHSESGVFRLEQQASDLKVSVQGVWLQQPLTITAQVSTMPKYLAIRQLRVTAPDTRFDLEGRYGHELALDWTLKTDRPGLWLEGAKGTLESRGHVGGTPEQPQLNLEVRGSNPGFNGRSANRLLLKTEGGIRPDDPLALTVKLDGVQAGRDAFDLLLEMRGTARRHTLSGRIDHPHHPVRVDGEGGWQGETWQGLLHRFDLHHPRLGTWTVQSPVRLGVGKKGLTLAESCWQSGQARWCNSAEVGSTVGWTWNTRIDDLPLARLLPSLPPTLALRGALQGQASLSGSGAWPETGRFRLDAPDLNLRYPVSASRFWQFRPERARLEGTVQQGLARLNLSVSDPAFADLSGTISTRIAADAPLTGQFRLQLPDLSVLESRDSGQAALLQGQGQLELAVEGTPASPKLRLQGGIQKARLDLPGLGVGLREVNVSLKPVPDQANRVALEAWARSGTGQLQVRGQGLLDPAQAWPWTLAITGKGVQLSNTRLAEVIVDPDLRLETGRDGIHLSGQAVIPRARIRLPDHPVVKVSADTIRVDQPADIGENGLALESELTLRLGDEVRFEGNGVNARLGGQLQLQQTGQEPGRAQGEIRILAGEYVFHSVRLPLDGGRLLYRHAPIDNPELDFNVSRQIEGIRAGVRVLGPLQKPGFTLYSEPVMPESEILAYLVSGKALNLSNNQDGRLMQQAAASLSGPVGNLLLGEITSRFGLEGLLDDVAVQTPRGTQTAALFLGKYLTPRLYLQYGVGLAQSSNVFRIRYELGKHWKIQSETGEQSGGDILFEMEKF